VRVELLRISDRLTDANQYSYRSVF
jgi:hypothetical protein